MAYSSASLALAQSRKGAVGYSVWVYDSTDTAATVAGAGYISDAFEKGMSLGDRVVIREWGTAVPTTNTETRGNGDGTAASGTVDAVSDYVVTAISTAGAATLSAMA